MMRVSLYVLICRGGLLLMVDVHVCHVGLDSHAIVYGRWIVGLFRPRRCTQRVQLGRSCQPDVDRQRKVVVRMSE